MNMLTLDNICLRNIVIYLIRCTIFTKKCALQTHLNGIENISSQLLYHNTNSGKRKHYLMMYYEKNNNFSQ